MNYTVECPECHGTGKISTIFKTYTNEFGLNNAKIIRDQIMKVLSYLELNTKKGDLFTEHLSRLKHIGFIRSMIDLEDFYSQPFKPELITELFEGWEEYTGIHDLYYNNYKSQEVRFNKNNKHLYDIYQDSLSRCVTFYKPRTLDDFITDCQRAGIQLIWKESK